MHDRFVPKLAKWPFLLGDLLLLAAAGLIYARGQVPLKLPEGALIAGCVGVGAFLAILPFVLEYRAVIRKAEANALTDVVSQIGQLEEVAAQIGGATARWQTVQEQADQTAGSAREIADRMTAEVRGFSEFMERTNDSEKATLRLEVEKLRRGEGEWLQIVVRMLDHVYALHQGAARSGQPNLIQQMSNFQHACREVARRVGLEPFAPRQGEVFDPEKHQVLEGAERPGPGAVVCDTIATGYTFQSRLLRQALVAAGDGVGAAGNDGQRPASGDAQSELPLPDNVGGG